MVHRGSSYLLFHIRPSDIRNCKEYSIEKVIKIIFLFRSLSFKTFLKIIIDYLLKRFDLTILPRSLYDCEIWSYDNVPLLIVYINVCYTVLWGVYIMINYRFGFL